MWTIIIKVFIKENHFLLSYQIYLKDWILILNLLPKFYNKA